MKLFYFVCLAAIILSTVFSSFKCTAIEQEIYLRNNLQKAQPGDYLVTAQNKNYTILLIREKQTNTLSIEEITVPVTRLPRNHYSWRKWIQERAPGHTCWVMYVINLQNGAIQNAFSFTKNEWFTIPESQNFLSTLLNLNLKSIPENERKKIGPPPASDSTDRRSIWQPPMIVDSKKIQDVAFNAWRTRWPKDNSELSNRLIEVYTPKESDRYPAYFPYWLQINGMVGKAKVRIIDSGSHLFLPNCIGKTSKDT